MSIAEHPPTNAPDPRTGAWPMGDFGTSYAARTVRGKLLALWSDRALRLAMLWGLAAWIILEGAFLVWVHRNAEGDSSRVFLPGAHFQVPAEAAAGIRPVAKIGYDGQMYYWMSNDLFGRYNAHEHMDEALYRYQRIGIPLIAGGTASLLGFELTPPLLYHTVQFGLTALGFGALVYWLLMNQLSPLYALGWLVSAGTLQSLWLGILDAPADALFVLTLLAVLAGRLRWYAPLATLLVLARGVRGLRLCHLRADGRGPLCLAGQAQQLEAARSFFMARRVGLLETGGPNRGARHRHVGLDRLPVVALPHVADQGAVESGRDELAVLHDGSLCAKLLSRRQLVRAAAAAGERLYAGAGLGAVGATIENCRWRWFARCPTYC